MALLELDQVTKHFGGLAAVNGVSLRAGDAVGAGSAVGAGGADGVGGGEILAIVGPNGAGKSTLLHLIVGLETPTRGTIRFAGEDISRYPAHRVRRLGIALVQQTPRTFASLTVLENAALGAIFGKGGERLREEQALAQAVEALAFVGLAGRRHEPVGNLNLHEKRFLELARAIAGRPRLLVLDEVMAGLNDAELEDSIRILRTIRERFGMTIILVEHVMKAVTSLAERTVVLNFGNVLTEGRPDEVMRHPAVIEAYLGDGVRHA